MTPRQGFDPFKKKPTPSGKTGTALPATGSPEDLLFAEESATVAPSERPAPEPWGTANAFMAAPPPPGHGDLAEQDELDLLAGIVDGAAHVRGRGEPTRAETALRPAAITPRPAPASVPSQPTAPAIASAGTRAQAPAAAASPGSVVVPALPPTPRAGTPAQVPVLLTLAAGAVAGAWFAVQGEPLLAAGAAALACAAAALLGTSRRRAGQ